MNVLKIRCKVNHSQKARIREISLTFFARKIIKLGFALFILANLYVSPLYFVLFLRVLSSSRAQRTDKFSETQLCCMPELSMLK